MKSFKNTTLFKYIKKSFEDTLIYDFARNIYRMSDFINVLKMINYHKNSNNSEIKAIISYIKKHHYRNSFINYDFKDKYKKLNIKVIRDTNKDLFYVMHNDKKMYFSRKFNSVEEVQQYYKSICIEQDKYSPHRYLNNNFNVNYNDIVVDLGAAEGNFSLEIIDKVKKLYIFECDDLWIEALKATFEPYKDKVQIVKKYVSNINSKKTITLDKFFKDKTQKVDFIKMDIEGEEPNALEGGMNLLKNNPNMKLAICAYHNIDDEIKIKNILKKVQKSFKNKKYSINANGYVMVPSLKKPRPPYLTRAVLRIQ